MAEIRRCPQCEAELPPDAPEGVCPKCLLGLALESGPTAPLGSADVHPVIPPARGAGVTLAYGERPSPLGSVRYFGDYELLEEVARGGMGVVFKARQLSLDRIVALKMILAGQLADQAEVQRFYTEARTAANLQHPNIVAIHEVGQYEAQHYFSMDFVEGRSLAEMVRENPLPPSQAARYVRIIAEAIHYAHQQGTLHRDLKPANVLVDPFDQPRVTDFGLAKCLGPSARLTASGAVVGTPAYMPPEQAAGKGDELGPPSDVYSLGTILYELVTGRPPFQAATPLDTLRQVLDAEPAPPRLLNRSVRRDLETIILKCLAKEPKRRYATAQDLADDLAAFLEGRPIKARRPSIAERLVRWMGKQRRSVLLSGATAAVSVLLILGAVLGWQWYTAWRQGQFVLTSDGPALDAEVLDARDEPIMPAFTVPTRQPVSLPAGTHRVRISGPRRLSETYSLLVERGLERSFEIGPSDRESWEPLDVTKGFEIVNLDGRSDVILVNEKGLQRIHGGTGKPIWERNVDIKVRPAQDGWIDYDWKRLSQMEWVLKMGIQPWLVRPAPELDRDGTRYLVWAGRARAGMDGVPWLLAVSAPDGKVKWCFRSQASQGGAAVCPPIAADVDGDGKPDLVAVFARSWDNPPHQEWAEAVSGKTGESIWRHTFGQQPWNDQQRYAATVTKVGDKRVVVIVAGRRLVGLDVHTGKEVWPVRDLGFEPTGTPVFVDLLGQGEVAVLLVEGNRLTALSPASGQTLWQKTLQTGREGIDRRDPPWPVVADLDGDGKPEIIVPYNADKSDVNSQRQFLGIDVLDGATGKTLWKRRLIRALYDGLLAPQHILAGPDLDGDGRRDLFTAGVIFPPQSAHSYYGGVPSLVVEASSGVDGRTRWRSLQPITNFHESARVGSLRLGLPGADGHPQLVVTLQSYYVPNTVSRQSQIPKTFGQTLVFSSTSGKVEHSWPGLAALDTTDFNGDGIPDLFSLEPTAPWLELRFDQANRPIKLHALRSSPPELWRRLGSWQPSIGRSKSFEMLPYRVSGQSGKLSPERSWVKAMDSNPFYATDSTAYVAPPQADLDGDGVPDVLLFSPAAPVRGGWTTAGLAKQGISEFALRAYSGKDGGQLWKADPRELVPQLGEFKFDNNWTIRNCSLLKCRDLRSPHAPREADPGAENRPEVLFAYAVDYTRHTATSAGGGPTESWLALLSGRDGKVLWKERLGKFQEAVKDFDTPRQPAPKGVAFQQPAFADLNGDGVLDVLVWTRTEKVQPMSPPGAADMKGQSEMKHRIEGDKGKATEGKGTGKEQASDPPFRCELRALDGREGQLLWSQPLPPATAYARIFCVNKPGAQGLVDVFVAAWGSKIEVSAWDGKSGQPKWKWNSSPHAPRAEAREDAPIYAFHPVLVDLDGDGQRSVCLLTVRGPFQTPTEIPGFIAVPLQPQLIVLNREGQTHRTLDFKSISSVDSNSFGLWSHDVNGDGKEELLVITGGKVQALQPSSGRRKPPDEPPEQTLWDEGPLPQRVKFPAGFRRKGRIAKPLWEWPLPGGLGDILDVHPAGKAHPAIVVVRCGDTVYGLDGRTGRPHWRCQGPGWPVACLAPVTPHPDEGERGRGEGALPTVWFHTSKPESTVCRQALPVDANGKSFLPPAPSMDPPAEDVGLMISLPWVPASVDRGGVHAAKQRLTQSILPALLWLGLFVYLARKRKWRLAIALLVCLIVIPVGGAGLQLMQADNFDEEHYSWSGWYWIWPDFLATAWIRNVLLTGLCAWLLWRVARRLFKKAKRTATVQGSQPLGNPKVM